MLLPLCTLDEVREELEETERDLMSMCQWSPFDKERWQELRSKRIRRRDALRAQIVQMEALSGSLRP
jgi:hypothetical protein